MQIQVVDVNLKYNRRKVNSRVPPPKYEWNHLTVNFHRYCSVAGCCLLPKLSTTVTFAFERFLISPQCEILFVIYIYASVLNKLSLYIVYISRFCCGWGVRTCNSPRYIRKQNYSKARRICSLPHSLSRRQMRGHYIETKYKFCNRLHNYTLCTAVLLKDRVILGTKMFQKKSIQNFQQKCFSFVQHVFRPVCCLFLFNYRCCKLFEKKNYYHLTRAWSLDHNFKTTPQTAKS